LKRPISRKTVEFVRVVKIGKYSDLVPALQRRGLVRDAYNQLTLRQTLRQF
jgi:hypothetical protein